MKCNKAKHNKMTYASIRATQHTVAAFKMKGAMCQGMQAAFRSQEWPPLTVSKEKGAVVL